MNGNYTTITHSVTWTAQIFYRNPSKTDRRCLHPAIRNSLAGYAAHLFSKDTKENRGNNKKIQLFRTQKVHVMGRYYFVGRQRNSRTNTNHVGSDK